ncbi:unnamed protein product [Effrenium voratum]|nr:unnamed protein product [Effrenium voratum]
MGQVKNFRGTPEIVRKVLGSASSELRARVKWTVAVRAAELRSSYTDFEYIYLTVLGLSRLSIHGEAIIAQNNGMCFTRNLAVQLLEQLCGMTMHADRPGSEHLLRTAPDLLLQAFALAKQDPDGPLVFFNQAFDRMSDPCLEGRVGRLAEYMSRRVKGAQAAEDFFIQQNPSASVEAVVGEFLRVFGNECTAACAAVQGLTYQEAVAKRQEGHLPGFEELCNASTFEEFLLAKGIFEDARTVRQWEVQIKGGRWQPYEPGIQQKIEVARVCGTLCEVDNHSFHYIIDVNAKVQRNSQTGKERPVRWVAVNPGWPCFPLHELQAAIATLVELQTLAEAPQEHLVDLHSNQGLASGSEGSEGPEELS